MRITDSPPFNGIKLHTPDGCISTRNETDQEIRAEKNI